MQSRQPTARQLAALRAHQFKPGQSGNPAGPRPSVASEAQAAADRGRKVFAVCLSILEDERRSPKDRLEAGKLLMAYAYGTPVAVTANLNVDASEQQANAEMVRGGLEALARALGTQTADSTPPTSTEETDHAA